MSYEWRPSENVRRPGYNAFIGLINEFSDGLYITLRGSIVTSTKEGVS